MLAPTHTRHKWERFGQLHVQWVRATETLKSSHRPHGKIADVLAPTHTRHKWERFGQLHVQLVRATETLKSSHRPHGEIADVLAPTHARTTAIPSVNYRMYVQQRPCRFPIARWETHVLLSFVCRVNIALLVCRVVVFVSMEARCQS